MGAVGSSLGLQMGSGGGGVESGVRREVEGAEFLPGPL